MYQLAIGTMTMTLVLLLAGALVTSTNSGMAFRTWPDSDDRFLWPDSPTLSGILEHSHRLIGAALGLTAILLVWIVFRRDRRPLMRNLSLALLGMIIVQGVLGGYRVLLNEQFPLLFPVLHGTLAHLVFALTVLVAFTASIAWVPRSVEDGGQVLTARRMAAFAWITVFVQIVFGVLFRHSNDQVAKWVHFSFAVVPSFAVLIAVGYSLGKFRSIPGFARMNRTCLAVLAVQIVMGFVALVLRRPKELSDTSLMGKATMVSLHVVIGAGLLGMMTVIVARSYRNLVPRGSR